MFSGGSNDIYPRSTGIWKTWFTLIIRKTRWADINGRKWRLFHPTYTLGFQIPSEEAWLDPKTYHPNTEPQEVFGRLGIGFVPKLITGFWAHLYTRPLGFKTPVRYDWTPETYHSNTVHLRKYLPSMCHIKFSQRPWHVSNEKTNSDAFHEILVV